MSICNRHPRACGDPERMDSRVHGNDERGGDDEIVRSDVRQL